MVCGAAACGGNASDANPSSLGSAGSGAHSGSGNSGNGSVARAGTAGTAGDAIVCGSKSCSGVVLPLVELPIPGCCADEATSSCGLDSSALASFGPMFAETCQPLAQPGTPDDDCPQSTKTPVALPNGGTLALQFPGCCRPNHTCGYQLDTVEGLFRVGLGCVDATPFLDGGAPQACGDLGAAGAGG